MAAGGFIFFFLCVVLSKEHVFATSILVDNDTKYFVYL